MKAAILFLLVAIAAISFWERHAIATLRVENAGLRAEQAAAEPILEEIATLEQRLAGRDPGTAETASNSGAAGASTPESDRTELLRLRNTVRSLRTAQADPTFLRADNERLAAALRAGTFAPQRLEDQPGFVPRAAWVNAGQATPEATLQSWVHAMREGNLDLFLPLLPDDAEGEAMRRQVQEDPVKARNEFVQATQKEFTASGFVFLGREELPGGKVVLKVKFGARSDPSEMEFQSVGGTWRITRAQF